MIAADDLARAEIAIPTEPTMRLGQISERLRFNVTAEFLAVLGFSPAGRDRAAVLYRASDFQLICAALVRHVRAVQAAHAAQAALPLQEA